MAWIFIAITVTGTVYGQLVLKWQVDRAGAFPDATGERADYLFALLAEPVGDQRLRRCGDRRAGVDRGADALRAGRAYPFVGLTFVTTLIGSALLFDEPLTVLKVLGTLIVVAGVVIASQG